MAENNKNGLTEYGVTMSNQLIRASHALTLPEKRLVVAAVAKTDSRKGAAVHAHLSEFQKLRITAQEYAETYGVDPKNAYDHLKKAADHLFERYVAIRQPGRRKGSERVTKFRWVSSCTYAKEEGFVELSFTPEAYPHLHALRREYTSYKLKNAAALRSVYAWRLYELAKSWLELCKQGKPVKVHIADLRHSLDVPETYRWQEIRRRALEPSLAEIKAHAGLEISYKTIKKGRPIVALDMYVKEVEQLDLAT